MRQERPIRIAIQQKGRLREASLGFFRAKGMDFDMSNPRALIARSADGSVEAVFVRNGDIPKYVGFGAADFGIVGENVLYEQDVELPVVKQMGFGQCSLVIAIPQNHSTPQLSALAHERIATKYPNSLRKFLQQRGINASIIELKGSVEIAPLLGLADAVCDITQTGSTLKEHGLAVIDKILDSQAVIIESPGRSTQKKDFINRYFRTL